jgi:broad specificity phosphatase PhoE
MWKVILIEPGDTTFDPQERIIGSLDLPLSAAGEQQVDEAAQRRAKLEFAAIYSAPCQAAIETATRLATPRKLRVRKIDELANVDFGLWHGKSMAELKLSQPRLYRQWSDHPEQVCPPGGETMRHAASRVERFVARLWNRRGDQPIAIVALEPLLELLVNAFAARGAETWKADCGTGTCRQVGALAAVGS